MTRVASIGECMIELSQAGDGLLQRGWGGDTLNTAVYLARLGVAVDYVTALGDDPWSDEMVRGLAGRRRGHEPRGARARPPARPLSHHHRCSRTAPLRLLARQRAGAAAVRPAARPAEIVAALAGYDLVYVSGISLSLYGEAGRERLLAALERARAQGRPRRLRHQLPRPRVARPGAGARGLSRGARSGPISCSPPPRTSTSCSAAAAWPSCRRRPACRGRAQAGRARRCASSIAERRSTCRPARCQRRRYDGRRRQLRRRLPGGAAGGCGCRSGGPVRPSPRRRRRAAPRGHHSARGDAGRLPRAPSRKDAIAHEQSPQRHGASAPPRATRRHSACRPGHSRHHHRARGRRRAAGAGAGGRRPAALWRSRCAHRRRRPRPVPSAAPCPRRSSASARC